MRKGKWTKFPNNAQIRREANREYWKFICPVCGKGASGRISGDDTKWRDAVSKGDYDYPFTNHVYCIMCGWKWHDPDYYFPLPQRQTILEEFFQ